MWAEDRSVREGEEALVFSQGTKPFIKYRKFHRNQRLKDLDDGRVRMTLKIPVNFETVNWVLSFGSNVEVVSPKELRDEVLGELRRAVGLYF